MHAIPLSDAVAHGTKNITLVDAHGFLGSDEDRIRAADRRVIDLLARARLIAVGNRSHMRSLRQLISVKYRLRGIGCRDDDIGVFQSFFRARGGADRNIQLATELLGEPLAPLRGRTV